MWRNYVICVLIGLLLVSTGGDVLLWRQAATAQAEAERLRAQVRSAQDQINDLQAENEQLKLAPTPQAPAPTVAAAPQDANTSLLLAIQTQVSRLRGLTSKGNVNFRFLDHDALRSYFVQKFGRDYLPQERETDQKLLQTLGLLGPNDDLAQILLDVLTEQVIGSYDEDDKSMYIVSDSGQFGAEEKTTFAHEFTHVLQDQYYDLNKLSPKHPDNDDRSLAIQALLEGDAVLIQRLWAQQYLTAAEQAQLGQGGEDSKLFSAPPFVRDQLLFPYGDGFNFVRQILQTSSGYSGVDEVFRTPPESTTQILHPDKYRQHQKPLEVALPDLPKALGAGWREIHSSVFGEFGFREFLERFTDRTRAQRGAAGWAGDRWSLLEKDDRQAVVLKTVWETDNDAQQFFDTFGLALKNRFGGAKEDASTDHQSLLASTNASDVRRSAQTVTAVISFDRPSVDAILTALQG